MLALFSVKRPYTVIVAIIVIGILGAVSVMNMTTDLLPSMNLPYAVVSTSYEGASPEQVEMVVTKPIEQAMASISNIKNVSSVSRENFSLVILEFVETANMDTAVIEMRESLDMIKAYMPEGVGTSVIMKLNPEMMPVMVLSAAVKGQKINESSLHIEKTIIPELESVEGVASVSASGLVESSIHVVLSQKKIDEVNQKIQDAFIDAMAAQMAAQNSAAQMAQQSPAGQASSQNSAAQTAGEQNLAAQLAGQQNLQIQAQNVEANGGQPMKSQDSEMLDPDLLMPDTGIPQNQTPAMEIPELKITRDMVAGILKGQNFSMPAGYITEDDVNYLVRTGDKIADLEELKKLPVMALPIPGMEPVVLEDVAEITVTDNSGSMYTKVNGNDAVMLTIQKQTEYATSTVTKSIHSKIEELMKEDNSIEIVPIMDQGKYIGIAVNSIKDNLIIGGVLAILILFIFLRDIKPTIVVGVSIPVSLVTAFVMMYFSNITLNVISMGGLALGVGMLVDNSIVVIENIYRMRSEGVSAREAAVDGAMQVAGAITSSTLTTIAVFLPIVFTQGLTRQIFTDMGLTIAYSLIASLIIALTLVPMVSSRILARDIKKEHRIYESVKRGYGRLLVFSLGHKWLVVVTVLVMLVVSVIGAFSMGTELFPESDSGQLMVTVNMPKGSAFEDTVTAADKVMEIISGIDDVETVGATISGGMFGMLGGSMGGGMRRGAGSGSSDSVSMYVLLKEDKTKSTVEVGQMIRDRTKDLDFEVNVSDTSFDLSALSGGTIAINIKGRELDKLAEISANVAKIVSEVEGTVEVSDGLDKASPEIRVTVDKEKSLANGLTVAQVFMEINKLLRDGSAATTISIGAKDLNVYVEDDSNKELMRKDIMDLLIETPQGKTVAVKDIATVEEGQGFSSIRRDSQQRYVTVTAGLAEGYNVGKVSRDIQSRLSEYDVPEGYTIEMGGEQEMIIDTFKDLFLMILLAVAFIYLIMVAQFQSLLSPFIVMFTLPLAFTGGFLALIIARMPVSVVALVGFLVLSGVVVNNGIVFVDYVNKLRELGMSKKDAIIKAGNDRLRPILMTALTTIIALSTTSMGAGQGTELMQPMAVTTIGGLLYATLLTLVFIPVLYDAFHRDKRKVSEMA